MRLASLFHDHAVLQRDQLIPVWGTAGPNELVTVTLAGQIGRVIANAEGCWLLRLPPQPAGGPFELVAESPTGLDIAHDILIGEVWICSGQSNMEWKLADSKPLNEAAVSALPNVRMFNVTNPPRVVRQGGVSGHWAVGTSEALLGFSGVGCWFARKIQGELGVPVGLIGTALGGTRIQAWMSREALMQDPVVSHEVRHYEERLYFPKSESEKHYSNFAEWEACGAPQDTGNRGLAEGWAAGDFYDGAWQLMSLPNRWQDQGHAANGVLWFRHVLTIPSAWFGEDLELHLGAVDKHDDTWVNGVWAGGLSWEAGPNTWLTQRVYSIPAHLVDKEGRVCISVRVRSHVFHGGLTGPVGEMYLTPLGAPESERLSLAGAWRYAVEQNWGVVLPPGIMWGTGGEHNANSLAILYESRIAPLVPYGIRGVLWYQGESNASEADEYRRLLPSMIRDWRRAWGQGDFPFLQVQLANFKSPVSNHCRSEWAELRDAQAAALSEPKVGMAVAIDVGDALDIHPRDKRSVGLRLAQWALAEAYGREGLPSGPIYAGSTAEAGGRIRIRFRHGQGLRTRDGLPPSHVAIARQNRTFEWAQSMIEGETLVVWHPEISFPMAVRYAWADNPEGCNLINVAGLPAAPFRTDSWQS